MVRSKISLKTLHKDLAKVTRSSSFGESLKERLKRGYQKHKKAIHIGLGVAGAVGTAAVAHHYLKKNKKAAQELKEAEHKVEEAKRKVEEANRETEQAKHKADEEWDTVYKPKLEEKKRLRMNRWNELIKNNVVADKLLWDARKRRNIAVEEGNKFMDDPTPNLSSNERKFRLEDYHNRIDEAEEQITKTQLIIDEDWHTIYKPKLEEFKQERMDKWKQLEKNATLDELLQDAQKRRDVALKEGNEFDPTHKMN